MFKPLRVVTIMAGLLPAILVANNASGFELKSPQISDAGLLQKAQVFNGFGCSGENRSPALNWSNPPKGTKSFALTVYDPDAPTGSGWWHWIVYNMPGQTRSLGEGAGDVSAKQLPLGAVQGRNDYGSKAFGGACPPKGHGKHRYQFRLFALDVEKLDLSPDASAALIGFMLNSHAIDSVMLEPLYGR